jgi:hypothetical protein
MRSLMLSAIAVLALGQNVAAGERSTLGQNVAAGERSALDRVAFAVDGAESSHGHDNAMWRADPTGPQGPMQVSAAAAADIGGGDRFDADQNRAIGRAYLHQLFSRYRNWPDAIAAYNWGIGNLNAWVEAGRPPSKLVDGVEAYIGRVLHDSGLCTDAAAPLAPRNLGPRNPGPRNPGPRNPGLQKNAAKDALAAAECAEFAALGAASGKFGLTSGKFYRRLDQAMQLAAKRLPAAQR